MAGGCWCAGQGVLYRKPDGPLVGMDQFAMALALAITGQEIPEGTPFLGHGRAAMHRTGRAVAVLRDWLLGR